MSGYIELQCTSHFSFLRGASSCMELFSQAAALGIPALGIVDRNSVAGLVRAHVAARQTGVRLIIGCRLDLRDGTSLLVYPTDRAAYGRLCRLLTLGKGRGGKTQCHLDWPDVETFHEGLLAILVPDLADDVTAFNLRRLKTTFGDRAYMALTLRRRPKDALRLHDLSNLAARAQVPTIVTNDVLFHVKERQILQDVVTCIRHNCTIDDAGFRLEHHADRYLKPPAEMARLFRSYPEAVARTAEIAERCRFSLDELVYQYPEEKTMPGLSAQQALEKLTWEGAAQRYPEGIPEKVLGILTHELTLINQLGYAPYFLTVNSIVRFARSRGILCQGRGSAANSAVCFVLGVTSIDPTLHDLLFERFVSAERHEPPDIDVDFEHERREEVIQWVYEHYGRNHAAITAVVQRFRAKGAVKDVGKALGLPVDVTETLSSQIDDNPRFGRGKDFNINLADRRVRLTIELARQLIDTPRHFSQHPGGFVLTHDRLDEMVPIVPAAMDDRQIIEWDKDDIDELKFMKVDVLGLGMLCCVNRAFNLLEMHKGLKLDMASIPADDKRTYDMISQADTLGTFQVESCAQMSMLPRLKPKNFYDLVIEVALVRPGPIQGDMVHPYMRRREGKEPVFYPKPELEKVLGKTLGVPLFQEQAMRVAIECAGFTPGQADQLRRSMATFKMTGGVSKYHDLLVNGMMKNGYEEEFAEKIFRQLEGFGSYGFPESHAASFALIAYASCWLKCWHPDAYCAALINSLPMGFWAPAQIVMDCRNHGVEVRPICINASRWDCTLEPTGTAGKFAVRLGFRLINGLHNKHAAEIVGVRGDKPFRSIDDLWKRANVPNASLMLLADADVFEPSLRINRRDAHWAIKALPDNSLPLFAAASKQNNDWCPEIVEAPAKLKPMTAGRQVVEDYGNIGLTLREHPISFLRADLAKRGIVTCAEAMNSPDKRYVQVAGMVLVRQMPGTAGVVFITLEDETGMSRAIVWPKVYETFRPVILGAKMLLISGLIQREGEVVHLISRSHANLSHELATVGDRDSHFKTPNTPGDGLRHGLRQDSRERAHVKAGTPIIKTMTRDFR